MIDVRSVCKRFGAFAALDEVSLQVARGELVALLGPSGSGKTTLLRIIAGLDFPSAGSVLFEGADATERPARDRRVGFVFQHFALFRHMTVFDNVAFGLKVRPRGERPSKGEISLRVRRLLEMVQLDGLISRYPSQLSGGQRQRVALARALAIEPKVLLLDEPFGALDAQVRRELRRWLRRLHDELGLTGVFVTHDQEEALEVADRVVVMNEGKIEQTGTPTAIYDNPASPFVYRFLGNVNSFPCTLTRTEAFACGVRLTLSQPPAETGTETGTETETGTGTGTGTGTEPGAETGARQGTAFVRPHDLEIRPAAEADSSAASVAVVRHAVVLGAMVRIELENDDGEVYEAEVPRERFASLGVGRKDRVCLRPRRVHIFSDGGERLNAVGEEP